jgi:hypothetical protein
MANEEQMLVRDLQDNEDIGSLHAYGEDRYLVVRGDWRRALLWRAEADVCLINMLSKAVISKWKLPGTFSQLRFLGDTAYCLFVEYQGRGSMCVIDTRTGQRVLEYNPYPPMIVDAVELSPGKSILAYSNQNGAQFLSLQTMKVLGTASTGSQAVSLRFGQRAEDFFLVGRTGRGVARLKLVGK